ncbi:DNA-binding transcriptional regulator FruR, partial [Pseudomonas syringae pv. japonica str. M301072]
PSGKVSSVLSARLLEAAGLRSRHSKTLGFILPDLENPSYARIA